METCGETDPARPEALDVVEVEQGQEPQECHEDKVKHRLGEVEMHNLPNHTHPNPRIKNKAWSSKQS